MSQTRDPQTRPEQAPPAPAASRSAFNTDTIALGALFVAMFAFIAAIIAVGLAARAIDEHDAVAAALQGGGGGAAAATAGTMAVTLTEFAITPAEITVAAGGRLTVTNEGSIEHDLRVEDRATPMLAHGQSAELDLAGLAPGRYVVICGVAGHEGAGMTATLLVT